MPPSNQPTKLSKTTAEFGILQVSSTFRLPEDISKSDIKQARVYASGRITITLKNGDTKNFKMTEPSLGIGDSPDGECYLPDSYDIPIKHGAIIMLTEPPPPPPPPLKMKKPSKKATKKKDDFDAASIYPHEAAEAAAIQSWDEVV